MVAQRKRERARPEARVRPQKLLGRDGSSVDALADDAEAETIASRRATRGDGVGRRRFAKRGKQTRSRGTDVDSQNVRELLALRRDRGVEIRASKAVHLLGVVEERRAKRGGQRVEGAA